MLETIEHKRFNYTNFPADCRAHSCTAVSQHISQVSLPNIENGGDSLSEITLGGRAIRPKWRILPILIGVARSLQRLILSVRSIRPFLGS